MSLEVKINFDNIIKSVNNNIANTLNQVGELIIDRAKISLTNRTNYNGSGKLINSLKKAISNNELSVYSDLKYANIQNEGGKIKVTEKMRGYFWSEYYRTKDEFWKNAALTKKTHFIIPKRPYLEISQSIIFFINSKLKSNIIKSLS
jgi:phage gpG-like protein